jgi:translocation and assembly module TamB
MRPSFASILPPRRKKRSIPWGRAIARFFCVILALVGVVPVGLAALAKSAYVRGLISRETAKLAKAQGIVARYDVGISFVPLAIELTNVRVEASDGKGPFLEAKRAVAKPRLFALMAGKLDIDQIEVESPKARVVLRDGKLANLAVEIPESKEKKPFRAPFNVISVSDADVDLVVDDVLHLTLQEVDADVAAEEPDAVSASELEIAVRAAVIKSRWRRGVDPKKPEEIDAEDDMLCDLDARVRIENDKILVRRFSTQGGADLDPEGDTFTGCNLPNDDKRKVEVAIHQTTILLPEPGKTFPRVDGRVLVRAPIALASRAPGAPDTDGWVKLEGELKFSSADELPDFDGAILAEGVRIDHFTIAQQIKGDLVLHKDPDPTRTGSQVVESKKMLVKIAGGEVTATNVKVRPLEPASADALSASVDVRNVDFVRLMAELGVSQHAHVRWDILEANVPHFGGSFAPLKLDGDFVARTGVFEAFDSAVDNPKRVRAVGLKEAQIKSHLAVRPDGVSFVSPRLVTPSSVVDGNLVFIGYAGGLRVDVPNARVDLEEISPIGNIVMKGFAEVKVDVFGSQGDPKIDGDVKKITGFELADLKLGDIEGGHVELRGMALDLTDVRGSKGKSHFHMPTGRLDFGGPASMRMDATITTEDMRLKEPDRTRDKPTDHGLLSIFNLAQDPRFAPIDGKIAATTQVHVALGGPEDQCGGGFISVVAKANVRDVLLFGEKFEDGHADFEYRWYDPKAGIDGAELFVRAMTLHKVHREGKGPVGSAIGSMQLLRGGELRGSLTLDGLPLSRVDGLSAVLPGVDGAASVVARLGGRTNAISVTADAEITPIRFRGKKLGQSHVHFEMVPAQPKPTEVRGHTKCGAPIGPPFDPQAYLADTSSAGDFVFDGELFDHQIKLDNLTISREKSQNFSGKVLFRKVDLGLVLGMASYSPKASDETDALDPLETTGGELSADMTIDKLRFEDLANARVTFAPKSLSFFRDKQRIVWQPAPVQIVYADDAIALPPLGFELASGNGLKGAFMLTGELSRVSSKDPKLDLRAELLPVDLGIFTGVVPKLTRASGKLSGAVRVTGRALQPDVEGEVKVRGGELAIQGLPSVISDVNVDVVADDEEIRVTRAKAGFAGGEVQVTGRAPLRGNLLGSMEARVVSRGLQLKPADGISAAIDTDVRITYNALAAGTGSAKLPHVSGEIQVASLEYTRPMEIDVNDALRGGAQRTEVKGYDPTLDSIVFGPDLVIRAKAPLRIRNNLIETQLSLGPQGLAVTGTNQRFGLRGEMRALPGGRVHLLANDFDIQQAVIKFDDASKIVPYIDIVATTDYRRFSSGSALNAQSVTGRNGASWRINLHVYGAYGGDEPLRLDMTADPALSREDIFLLLTVGLTRTEVDQARLGDLGTAVGQAFANVTGADRAVKQAVNVIDDFRFGSAYSPRTGRTEPQITVGRRLSDDVRASVTKSFTDDQLRGNVEWRLSRTTSVQANADNVNNSASGSFPNIGLDFRFRLQFE